MNRIYFREEQRYTQWWVWLLLLLMFFVSVIPLWYGVYVQTVENSVWGKQPIETDKLVVVSIVVTLFVSAIVILFVVQKLETVVSSEGIRYRYPPFIRKWKNINWNTTYGSIEICNGQDVESVTFLLLNAKRKVDI